MPARLHEYVSYSDESCTTAHDYMIIGGVVCAADLEIELIKKIDALLPGRPAHWSYEWKHIRPSNAERYADFIDLFFEYNKSHSLDFKCIVLECAKFDHREFNDGDGEKGFNKFLYQYLSSHHRELGPRAHFRCYHDQRTSKYDLDEIKKMLNAKSSQRDMIPSMRYRELAYSNLRTSPLIQFADVLIGAVGYCRNKKMKPDSRSPKNQIAEYIRKHACINVLGDRTPHHMRHFDIWDFELKAAPKAPSPR